MEISNLSGKKYYSEDVWYIPNMQQNYKYLNSGKAYSSLVDIVCGKDGKLIFVWEKNKTMKDLYNAWCNRELG